MIFKDYQESKWLNLHILNKKSDWESKAVKYDIWKKIRISVIERSYSRNRIQDLERKTPS